MAECQYQNKHRLQQKVVWENVECSLEKYKNYNMLLRKIICTAKTKFYNEMCWEYKSQTKNCGV